MIECRVFVVVVNLWFWIHSLMLFRGT